MNKFIYILMIVLLLIMLSFSVRQCNSYKHEYNTNLITMHDSINYYKSSNGQLVATKKLYETDIKHLKYLNDSLYKSLKNMKVKNVVSAANVNTTIINKTIDTCYIIKPSDIVQGVTEHFDYSNRYRTLVGQISYHPDTLELKIDSDKVYVDFTVAMDKKNRIHVVSNNPYVQYNEITGFTVPKTKQKRWSIGPFVGYGINLSNGKPEPQVGIGISYGLIKF